MNQNTKKHILGIIESEGKDDHHQKEKRENGLLPKTERKRCRFRGEKKQATRRKQSNMFYVPYTQIQLTRGAAGWLLTLPIIAAICGNFRFA